MRSLAHQQEVMADRLAALEQRLKLRPVSSASEEEDDEAGEQDPRKRAGSIF
jgi:hypothetical protein